MSKFESVVLALEAQERKYGHFRDRIALQLSDPDLALEGIHCVHSTKSRRKTKDSIVGKCERKGEKGTLVTPDNCFDEIEDFYGLRVLHLHFDQIVKIHEMIINLSKKGEWTLGEPPKAYTWDREAEVLFGELGFDVQFKESFYTSVHYILRASDESPVRCEVQVRTLFEEVWGEIDHWTNYPAGSASDSVKEQLVVLSKLVATGSRLAVAIARSHRSKR